MGVKSQVYMEGQAVVNDGRIALVVDIEFSDDRIKPDLENVRYVVYDVDRGEMSTVEHSDVWQADGDDLEELL